MTATMTPKKARSIIIEAKKDHGEEPAVYEGEIPEDDDKAIKEAEQLVSMAESAKEDGWESDAVDAVLALYHVDGGTASDPNVNGGAVAESQGDDEPWDGYGKSKVSEIMEKLPDLDEDELAQVYDYEKATKNRSTLVNALEVLAQENAADPDDGDPEPEPDEPVAVDPPWRGYDKRKADEIIKVLPNKDEVTLEAVYDYETANKNRAGVLKALAKEADRRGLVEDTKTQEAPPSGPEEDQGSEGAEGRAGEDAGVHASGEADASSGEGHRTPSEEDAETRVEVAHEDLISEVTKRVEQENLSVPKRPPVEKVEMPFDLTECSDRQIRQLHSAQTAYFARAAYVAKLERELEKACKHVADRRAGEVMRGLPKLDPETKKEKNVTALKNEVDADETVQMWREREYSHSQLASSFGKDCDIYTTNISSLSREWTMRHEEMEHSGSLPQRRSR